VLVWLVAVLVSPIRRAWLPPVIVNGRSAAP
jgi:hypothetical protein